MASNLRRTDDLQRLKTRELVMQRTDGSYAAENSVPRFGTATGDMTTSNVTIDPYDNVVIPGETTTAQITTVNGNINLSTADYRVERSGNDLLWISPTGTTVLNAPTVVDSNIIAESLTVSNGTINLPTVDYRVERSGNDLLWIAPTGTTVLNAPTVVDSNIIAESLTVSNGTINLPTADYRLDNSGNDLLWISPAGTTVLNAPMVVDSNIIAESLTVSNGTINLPTADYRLDNSGNDLLWISPTGTTVLNAPTVIDSNIVAESLTVSNGTINLPTADYRLDNSGNDLLWISPTGTTVLNALGLDLARGGSTLTLLDASASTTDIITAFNSLVSIIAAKNVFFTLVTPTPLLSITSQTYTTLTVSWSPSIPTTDTLTLYRDDVTDGVIYNASGSYTFTNLEPGVSHTVRGKYRTNNSESVTLTGATSTLPYTGFTAVADSTTSIAVAWNVSPSSEITGVEIWYAVVGAGYTLASTVLTPTTSASITGLTPGTQYSVYVQYIIGVHTGPYTSTTVQTLSPPPPPPPAPLQFGPLSSGKPYGTDNVIYGRESGNGFPSLLGYRVPEGSSWIGYQFNRVLFPKHPNVNAGVLTSLNPYGDGLLQISVYTDSTLSNLVASSLVVTITNQNHKPVYPLLEQWGLEYTFAMNTTVTLAAGMYIIFRASGYGEVRFRVFTSVSSDPIIGIKNGPSSQPPQPISDAGTNSSALCDFKLV